jgi:hypothetical protein
MVYLCESPSPTVLSFGYRDPPLVAGNSSLPFTLSGMSSEGVARTDGQYGSVTFPFGFRHCPLHNRGLIFTCCRFTLLLAWRRFWP